MAEAYDTYADLRAEGPVSRVRFAGGGEEKTSEDGAKEEQPEFFNRETFVTHYDDVVATLLDDRFSVDPRSLMTPEQREQTPEAPEEFRPLTQQPAHHRSARPHAHPQAGAAELHRPRHGGDAAGHPADRRRSPRPAEREAAARGEAAPNRRMELIEAFAYPFPVTVISDMLGIPREDREQIRGWTENLLRVDRAGRERWTRRSARGCASSPPT